MDWPVLLPILICSILVLAAVINRFSFYKKNKQKYLSTGDKSDKIFDASYKKAYKNAIKSGASKSTAENAGYDAAMKYAGAYNKKVKDEYKKTKKKLKQDRYYIKKIGV